MALQLVCVRSLKGPDSPAFLANVFLHTVPYIGDKIPATRDQIFANALKIAKESHLEHFTRNRPQDKWTTQEFTKNDISIQIHWTQFDLPLDIMKITDQKLASLALGISRHGWDKHCLVKITYNWV